MLAETLAGTIMGVDGCIVRVEVDLSPGLPGVRLVGLPDATVQESRERVRAAIRNSGLTFPVRRITVNLSPASVRKSGGAFDLAVALGILAGSDQVPAGRLAHHVLWGELSLDGSLRPVPGLLALALALPQLGPTQVIAPIEDGRLAAFVPDVTVRAARTLGDVVGFLRGDHDLPRVEAAAGPESTVFDDDLADVRGQPSARRALEIAAAGQHNLLLVGSPGCGKTMLATRLPSILPPLEFSEQLEVARIQSVAGLASEGLSHRRPFRAPHHTASDAAIVGGGPVPRPGEVSLAHRGVLFLDELPEFRRSTLEVLRQPLVDGRVTVARARASLTFPADICLVAAMNPCPCGFRGDPTRVCRCSPTTVQRYLSRVSGPLLDRIDMCVEVTSPTPDELLAARPGELSARVRERVLAARAIQRERLCDQSRHDRSIAPGTEPALTNGRMSPSQSRRTCTLRTDARRCLERVARTSRLTARGLDKVVRVARTIADLEGGGPIDEARIAEAASYRCLDRSRAQEEI